MTIFSRDLLGLAGHLGIVGHLSHHNLLLLIQHVLSDLALVPEAGIESGDLHGHILADLGGVDAAGRPCQVDQHADLAAGVDIGDGDVLREAGKAADLDVLADDQNHLLLLLRQRSDRCRAYLQSIRASMIGGASLGDGSGHALDEI